MLFRARASRAATLVVAALLMAPRGHAQSIPDLNAPKRAAQNAVRAEDAQLSAQTGQDVRRGAPPAPLSGPASAPAAKRSASASKTAAAPSVAATMQPVTREVYSYESTGSRDPFYSLILTEDLRPLLSDLKLVGILYTSGGRSVAIMRDLVTNAQYRVGAGTTLGRMRVAQIKPRSVIFTIDEFGLSRQDSLFLSDTSKARVR